MMLRNLPNLISAARIVLVAPVVWYILQENYSLALLLFVIAGVSDGVDGFLAKRFHWQSRLGSILDPLADKLLIILSYAAVMWTQLIPLWLWLCILARDVIIVTGALTYHFAIGKFEMAPSLVSKFNTVVQIFLLVLVLGKSLTTVPSWFMDSMVYLTLVTVLLSGLDYMIVWGRKAMYAIKKATNND